MFLKKSAKNFFFSFLAFLLFAQNLHAAANRNLTVFTEQNLVPAFVKISRLYSQKNHVSVTINFNSSEELIGDVDSGEPVDIFISAHPAWIETLKQKGLTDIYNTGHIASDKLVLVTSKNNHSVPPELLSKNLTLENALKILNQMKGILITDQEESSSGKFSNDLIRSLQLSDLQLFNKVKEDKSSVLDLAGDNEKNYAILLASQIKNRPNLQILAAQKKENIFYQALVIAGDNMETAREFLKFLKSDTAKKIMRENGLLVE